MAATTMTAGLKTASFVASKIDAKSLKAAPAAQSFGVKKASARVSCSAQEKSFIEKAVEGAKVAAIAVASSALIASGAQADTPRLSFDELQGKTYSEIKGTGIANQCPSVPGGADGLTFKAGKYSMTKFCMEPTSITVKTEKTLRGVTQSEFTNTKLMTRLTYTLDEMEGPFEVKNDGTVVFAEDDGIDYAAVTVQLPGGERVPFLFTVKELVASGPASGISGSFTVPSYRGATFLDPKGRGGSTGYDNAVALPAGGAGDEEELAKENDKSYKALSGNVTFTVTRSDTETGEITGTFVSVQPSDTDMGAKVPKDVKIEGIWYAQLD